MKTFGSRVHLSLCIVFFSSILALIVMAESTGAPAPAPAPTSEAKVHIVYTKKPTGNEDPKAYHLRTLTSALGSEQAAKDALIYTYKEAATGFSARLTLEQVAEISKQPGVIQVVPSQTYKLHTGGVGGFKLH